MIEMDVQVAVYLVTGFLESGKSTFLDFTIRQDYFQIEEPSLLLLCEEGIKRKIQYLCGDRGETGGFQQRAFTVLREKISPGSCAFRV